MHGSSTTVIVSSIAANSTRSSPRRSRPGRCSTGAASWKTTACRSPPIRHLDEIYSDPHTAAIGMVGTVDHASGPLEQIALPVNFGGARPPLRSAPPLHGEHTDEILAGYQEVSVPS